MRVAKRTGALILAGAVTASCVLSNGHGPRSLPDDLSTITLAGQFSIPPLTRFPPPMGLVFGGISGLAPLQDRREMFGISDDDRETRIYRLRLSSNGQPLSVAILDHVSLERPRDAPHELDPEGVVVAPTGNFIISSEGVGNVEPRVPPAIIEFGPNGEYLRQLEVPDRFVPNPTGPLTKGVRANFGFEALAMTSDGSRLYTASETALAQDGDVTAIGRGANSRLVEYVRRGRTYVPGREFVYPVEPVFEPPFEAGLAVNGLVDLIALDDGRLLAMERTYVEEAGNTGRGLNRIRLFRVDLTGATDVSSMESLREAGGFEPVTKAPLLDLSNVSGLSPELVPALDNFEGMAFGPRLPDGRPSLLLVSDDNFNPTQRTWFVLLGLGEPRRAQRVQ